MPCDFGFELLEFRLCLPPPCFLGAVEALGSGSKPSTISFGIFKPTNFSISLKKTTDILHKMGLRKTDQQFLVGFALETENELISAKEKMKRKNLDMIVLNSLNDKGAGFGCNTNKITIIDKQNILNFELKDKAEVAHDIIARIIKLS